MSNDDEVFADKLRHAFDRLFNQTRHRVQDDTLLQKLRDLLKSTLGSTCETDGAIIKRREIILAVLQSELWIPALTQNQKLLNCHVIAFGLALIGDLAAIEACHPILMTNTECLRTLLKTLTVSYGRLHASVRCSMMTTLRNVWTGKKYLRDSLLADIDISCILLDSLMDGSIFVAREAKELTVDYLILELKNQLVDDVTVGNRSSDEFEKVLSWLIGIVREVTAESDRKALISLEVFGSVIAKDSSVSKRLCQLTNLKVAVMDRLIDSENESVCNACCFLLITSNSWSFEAVISTEWMTLLEMLMSKKSLTTAATFIVTTCHKLRTDHCLHFPAGLMSLLIEPIAICFEWKARENETDVASSSKWSTLIRQSHLDRNGLVKLCSYCLINVPKLHSFLSSEEKLDFIKMLTSALMETGNVPVLTLSPKIQTSVMSALMSFLEETCVKDDSFGLQWTVEDRLEIWRKVIKAAEQPSSSALVSTKRMQLIRVLLRGTDDGLHTIWNTVGTELSELLQKRCHDVHWEVRDSCVETFGEILQKSKHHTLLSDWCVKCGLLSVLVASMDDVEGYVRASILKLLSIVPTASPDVYAEATKLLPFGRFFSIVLMDDEGVVRRAAAKALMAWTFATKLRKSLFHHVANTFLIASADLDWEVKLISVEFWKITLENSINSSAETESDLLEILIEIGFCNAITLLCTDQDVSVMHETATLVQKLKNQPVIENRLLVIGNDCVHDVDIVQPKSRLPIVTNTEHMSDEAKYAAIDNVLDTVDSNLVNDVMVSRTEQPVFSALPSETCENDAKLDTLITTHHRFHPQRITERKFLHWLRDLDLEALLKQSDQTTDIYETNPETLLDDLVVTHEESETEEEISLDCY